MKLSGKEVSSVHRARIKDEVKAFTEKFGKPPGLAVVLVGDDAASQVYVRNKEKACADAGIYSARFDIDKEQNVEELESLLNRLNADQDIHGVLVQIPLPKPFDYRTVLEGLNPEKDVDGLTYDSLGRLWSGHTRVSPCTPKGVMAILEHYDINVAGKKAVVIGRSNIVGKPMAQLLQAANATVTVCHSKTQNLSAHTRDADILVVAAGSPEFIGRDNIKKGAVVIDVGIHRKEDGTLTGDVRYSELEGHAFAATPVPGGVGPMTITMLLQNTLDLARLQEETRKK